VPPRGRGLPLPRLLCAYFPRFCLLLSKVSSTPPLCPVQSKAISHLFRLQIGRDAPTHGPRTPLRHPLLTSSCLQSLPVSSQERKDKAKPPTSNPDMVYYCRSGVMPWPTSSPAPPSSSRRPRPSPGAALRPTRSQPRPLPRLPPKQQKMKAQTAPRGVPLGRAARGMPGVFEGTRAPVSALSHALPPQEPKKKVLFAGTASQGVPLGTAARGTPGGLPGHRLMTAGRAAE